MMAKREAYQDVELAGKRFRIKKFDALLGSCVATKLMGKIGHILAGVASGKANNEIAIAMAVSEALGSMSKVEFMEMQTDALSVVGEVKIVGQTEGVLPVRMPNGAWSDDEIAGDIVTVMALITHSLIFNLSPFFDESALKSAIASFQGLSLFSALTSTSSPTAP
jgi:hypothetical protein